MIGTGGAISRPQSTAGRPRAFFRLKHLPTDAVSASFDPLAGVLTIVGGPPDEVIVVSRNAAGTLRVNGGSIPISGGVPTVANTVLISVSGAGGNDQLLLDESHGALPKASLAGDAGNVSFSATGNLAALIQITVDGGPGNDSLLGSNGNELFDVSANGSRVRLTRNLGSIVMDCDGIENLGLNGLGGPDTIIIGPGVTALIGVTAND